MNRVYAAGCLVIIAISVVLLVACGSPDPDAGTASPPVVARASDTPQPVLPAGSYPAETPTPDPSPTPPPPGTGGQGPATPTATSRPTLEPAATSRTTPRPTSTATPKLTLTPELVATRTAPPLPTATVTRLAPSPTPRPGGPQVLSFLVEPSTARNVGDTLRISWRAIGETARLCPMTHGPVESRCWDVSLEGSTEYVTTEESLSYVGLGLKVSAGDRFVWGTQNVSFLCENLRPWFFPDPPLRCPAAGPVETYAAGQYFERGLMIWREDTDLFYVLCEGDVATYDQRLYVVSPSTLSPDASPGNRVGEEPPPGLYEPRSGFGMVWRGELQYPERDFRECLGWATEPEGGFTLVEQCETAVLPGAWACYVRAPRGEILRLAAATNAGYPLIWEVYRP
ncbi:MAG TPA: hypothetical protein VLC95_00315 [Anaerolineae bacterium]|nr:hypothetical protein [Anaerolineae bacterium]